MEFSWTEPEVIEEQGACGAPGAGSSAVACDHITCC